MKERTKDIKNYVIINFIFLIVACLLVFYVVTKYKTNKENIISSVDEQTNVIISSIKAESEENKTSDENTNLVFPVVVDSSVVNTADNNTTYYKYYYSQLNSNAKKIYSAIENNADNIKTGTYTIKLSSDIADTITSTGGTDTLNRDFQSAWDAITMDRVDLFYINVSKVNLKIKSVSYGNSVSYTLTMGSDADSSYLKQEYANEQNVNVALSQTSSVANQIIERLSGNDYNKVLQVHDWLVNNLTYSTESGGSAYDIYGGLILNKAVCEGYAESFKYIMDKINIPCVIVTGTATNSDNDTENHEWDYIQLNGKWYAVDATWDDPILKQGATLTNSLKHQYFLKGSTVMNKNHFPNGRFSSSGMIFTYPNIESENY